jgi:hypothetical protein
VIPAVHVLQIPEDDILLRDKEVLWELELWEMSLVGDHVHGGLRVSILWWPDNHEYSSFNVLVYAIKLIIYVLLILTIVNLCVMFITLSRYIIRTGIWLRKYLRKFLFSSIHKVSRECILFGLNKGNTDFSFIVDFDSNLVHFLEHCIDLLHLSFNIASIQSIILIPTYHAKFQSS